MDIVISIWCGIWTFLLLCLIVYLVDKYDSFAERARIVFMFTMIITFFTLIRYWILFS